MSHMTFPQSGRWIIRRGEPSMDARTCRSTVSYAIHPSSLALSLASSHARARNSPCVIGAPWREEFVKEIPVCTVDLDAIDPQPHRAFRETEWNFKPDEIGDLHLAVPNTGSSEAKLIIQLVAPNGGILAATTTILNVMAGPEAKTTGPEANIPVYAVKTQLIQGQPWDRSSQELNAMDAEESSVNLDAAKAASSGDTVPLPTPHPAPIASGDVDASWIKPSASVHLRKGPKSSAPVVGVVAKGAKLRVISRKRGWVEVTNPATSQQGWIYAGVVEAIR